MWMTRRLERRQHGRHARVGVSEHGLPLIARLRPEDLREPALRLRPGLRVHLLWHRRGIKPEALEQLRVELRLDRADRNMFAIGGLVHIVERRPGVDEMRARARLVVE